MAFDLNAVAPLNFDLENTHPGHRIAREVVECYLTSVDPGMPKKAVAAVVAQCIPESVSSDFYEAIEPFLASPDAPSSCTVIPAYIKEFVADSDWSAKAIAPTTKAADGWRELVRHVEESGVQAGEPWVVWVGRPRATPKNMSVVFSRELLASFAGSRDHVQGTSIRVVAHPQLGLIGIGTMAATARAIYTSDCA